MEATSRQRPVVLLVAVVLAQVLLLAFQIKRERDVRLIRVWSVELLTPLQSLGTNVFSGIGGFWSGYVGLRHEHAENQQLHAEIARLQLRNQQLEGEAAEAARLARVLGFRQDNPNVPMIAAEVIGASADSSSHTVFINRGEKEGLRRNTAVVTPDGVIGKIYEVTPHVAQVLLITDKESGVGALLAGSRAQGVIKGTGEPLLRMDYVTPEEKVSVGDEVLTSGEDRIFPKDVPIGTVASVKTGYPFQTITVEPAAHLDRLEEVLVLESEQPLNLKQAAAASQPKEETPTTTKTSNEVSASPASPSASQPKVKPAEAKPSPKKAPALNPSPAAGQAPSTTTPEKAATPKPSSTKPADAKSSPTKPAATPKKPGGGTNPSGTNPSGTSN